MPEFRTLDVGRGISIRAALEGDGPLVVMVHGFPESWYSWRHQMAPIAAAGFTACAIDVRGYGGSSKPHPVADYAMNHMVDDVVGVVDALSPDAPGILLGHDWGAPIVWNTALTRPDRIRAVGALSVPYTGVPPRPFNHIFDEVFTKKGRFFYQAYFQAEGVAEAELEADLRGFVRKFLFAISGDAPDGTWPNNKTTADGLLSGLPDPEPFPAWASEADIGYFVGEFERSGLRGPINRYRNHEADFAFLDPFRDRRIEQPALFIGGTRDPAYSLIGRTDPMPVMRTHVPDLRVAEVLEGCGHWTQQERPAEVNALIVPWLKGL